MSLVTQSGNQLVTQSGNTLTKQGSSMFVPIEDLRVRVGLNAADSSKDLEINAAYDLALDLMEKYCDRKFAYAAETEVFTHFDQNVASLIRYPIEDVTRVNLGGADFHVEKPNGLIHFDYHVHSHELVVEYTGGYKVLPPGLLLAFMQVFDKAWDAQSGGVAGTVGGIKSARIGDLAISYDTSDPSLQASSGGAMGGLVPTSAMSILNLYRREFA